MKPILLFTLILFSNFAFSQTVTWDGSGDGVTWEDADNWDLKLVPCSTCDVEIFSSEVIISSNVSIKSLKLQPKPGTTIHSNLTVQAGFLLEVENAASEGIEISNNSNLLLNGQLSVSNCPTGIQNYGTIEIANSGILTVSGNSFMGIFTLGTIDIEGVLNVNDSFYNENIVDIYGTVNTQGASLFRNHFNGFTDGVIHIYSSGIFNSVNSTADGIHNSRSIINEGIIMIDNAFGNAISNNNIGGNALFTNAGDIDISNCSTGIFSNGASFINELTGSVSVVSSSRGIQGEGVTNNGNFFISGATYPLEGGLNNAGYFHATNSTYGIRGTAAIENQATGTIKSSMITNSGIEVFNFHLVNEGIIQIDTCGDLGLDMYNLADSLINKGQILVNKTVGIGIRTWGTQNSPIHNYPGAVLKTSNTTASGMRFDSVIDNEGQIEAVNSQNAGIELLNSLTNKASLSVNNVNSTGISIQYFTGNKVFNNTNTGIVDVSFGSEGISIGGGSFMNFGQVQIEGVSTNGITTNSENLINHGTIEIDDAGETAFAQGGFFENASTGNVLISDSDVGFLNSHSMMNKGSIEISNGMSTGFENNAQSDTLYNEGTILISHIGGVGFDHNPLGVDNLLQNEITGKIEIENCSSTGLFIDAHLVHNFGLIKVDQCQVGIEDNIFDPNPSTNQFSNFGSILVTNSVEEGFITIREFYNRQGGMLEIYNSGTNAIDTKGLTNENFAWIKTDGPIYAHVSIKDDVNDGFIIQDTKVQNSIYNTFLNNGVFVEYNRLFPSSGFSSFVNNGHVIQPPAGFISPGVREFYVLHAGTSPLYSLHHGIWANASHTLLAGNIDPNDGSLLPTVDSPSTDSLYFSFSISTTSEDIPVNINNEPVCNNVYKNLLFHGNQDDNWQNRLNYSPQVLPGPCSNVTVNPYRNLTVPSSTKARARTLQFTAYGGPNASFVTESGSVLLLNPAN
ncbi:hypothetical protein [Jiulongibacter sp. NS-SX5]|uniref:hypothetical protein n=1 Tax=Jiulongibacter sp. NS-SX5 TaxID=3463854 RepID=UPI004058C048